MSLRTVAATVFLAASALGRTDIAGCTYVDTVVKPSGEPAFASRIFYVPGTGEVCAYLDCGGGRAPPKTNVPGCPLYSGTETYSPSFVNLQTLLGDEAADGTATTTATTTTSTTIVKAQATASQTATVSHTTFLTSASDSTTASEASTTAAPTTSTASSPAESGSRGTVTKPPHRNGNVSSAVVKTTSTKNGAVPTAAAFLGSCLVAGVAACVGML